MSDYKTPLPGFLARLLETGINQVLSLDEDSADSLERLDDRTLRLDLKGLEISLVFSVSDGRFQVGTGKDEPADTIIRGTPAALFSMSMPDWGSSRSGVEIQGDAGLAKDMERLFRKLDPDWDEPLARLFGDVLGHQLATGIRQSRDWAGKTMRSTSAMLRDYLQEESRVSVHPREMKSFNDAVDELRDAIERLDAKLKQQAGDS